MSYFRGSKSTPRPGLIADKPKVAIQPTAVQSGSMKKSVLVIGGTQFVGRHIVELGLAQGHDITLFTRGKTNPELFPDAKHIVGDRRTGIALIGDTH